MWTRLRDCFKPPPSVDIENSIVKIKEVSKLLQQQISKYDSEINMAIKQLQISIKNKESKRAQIYYLKRKNKAAKTKIDPETTTKLLKSLKPKVKSELKFLKELDNSYIQIVT